MLERVAQGVEGLTVVGVEPSGCNRRTRPPSRPGIRMRRALYGLLAFLPLTGVVSIAIWVVATTFGRPALRIAVGPTSVRVPALSVEELLPIAAAIVVTALIQIATSLAFIAHCQRDPRLNPNARIRWMLLVLFVGSIAQPIYWAQYVRTSPP